MRSLDFRKKIIAAAIEKESLFFQIVHVSLQVLNPRNVIQMGFVPVQMNILAINVISAVRVMSVETVLLIE